MNILFYKMMHATGLLMLFMGLALFAARARLGGDQQDFKRLAAVLHGIGLLFLLVGGFGMAAKLHLGFPAWLGVKLILWLALGGIIVWPKKQPRHAAVMLGVTLLLGVAASLLAVFKPF